MKEIPSSPQDSTIRLSLFGLWALITFGMVFSAQVSGDQLNLLARGYLFAQEGVLVPFGNPMSGGGKAPGSITSLLVGAPLLVWFNHLAPQFLLWISQLLAYVILDRALSSFLSMRERILFCLCYLLTPWHTFFSVFLWNPHYLYLIAAVHVWAVIQQRERASFWVSLIHTFAIGVGFQLHGSVFILLLHVGLLFFLRYIRFSYLGAVCGAALVGLTLIPWAQAVVADPSLLPSSKDGAFLGRGLLYVYPMLRGILYAVEATTFLPSKRVYRFDFTPQLGEQADAVLTPTLQAVGYALGALTMVISVLSVWWMFRRAPLLSYFKQPPTGLTSTEWFVRMVFLGHVAMLLAFALSPTSIAAWQILVLLPIFALRMVLFLREWLPAPGRLQTFILGNYRWLFTAGVVVLVAIGIGAPQYRYGGRKSLGLPLRNNHPMLTELKLLEKFELKVYPNGYGWWMDVFPDAFPPEGGPDNWEGKPWEDSDWRNPKKTKVSAE